ncbi:MAG TPA: N-acetyltransferase [Micromonosporaceae bacterium]
MIVRTEQAEDVDAIRAVTRAAFAKPDVPDPMEARLVDELRADAGWISTLSHVAVVDGTVVGHVVSTRAVVVDGAGAANDAFILGLGPLSVLPAHQRRGIGSALVHTNLGAADALGAACVVLLGSTDYYRRFGFEAASEHGIDAPNPDWGRYFQVRRLRAYRPEIRGTFRYASPFPV